mmetsp:Transcript_20596/g.57450  ORF Transcript_20596/g.57450 Transcript_20596/m.57450 type:complete len:480 (+) Transcript_20596:27-1466(+)
MRQPSRFPDHGHDGVRGHVHLADCLHPLLAVGLLPQQLHLPGDVAAVALGQHVLPNRVDGTRGRDHGADPRLYDNLDLLPRNLFLEDRHNLLPQIEGSAFVDDLRQGVCRDPVDVDLQLDQISGPIVQLRVVHGRIASGELLQVGEIISDHLGQRHLVLDKSASISQHGGGPVDGPPLLGELHALRHIVLGHNDLQEDKGLPNLSDLVELGQQVGKLDLHEAPVLHLNLVYDRRGRHDQVQVVLSLQPLLNDLHVEHPQEAATVALAQGHRVLGLPDDGRVVQSQLLEGARQPLDGLAGAGEEPAEDHGHCGRVTRQRLYNLLHARLADGVAHAGVGHLFDLRAHVADLPTAQAGCLVTSACDHKADLLDLELLIGGHQSDLHAFLHGAADDAEQRHDAHVLVVDAVVDQGPQRLIGSVLRWRDQLDESVDDGRNTKPRLRRARQVIRALDADHVLNLLGNPVRVGVRQIHLVQHWDDR